MLYMLLARGLAIAAVAVCCAFAGDLAGQTPTPRTFAQRAPITLEGGAQWGVVAAHRSEIWRVVTGHAWGGHLYAGAFRTGGWTSGLRRPWAWQGLGLDATYGGSPELGWQVSGIWLNRLPLNDHWNSEWGLGLGYTSRPYDPVHAPSSFLLGSPFNAAIRLGLHRSWPFGPGGAWHTTLAVHHLSNGSTRQPNLGTNTVALHLGWSPATPNPPTALPPTPASPPASPRFSTHWALRVGYRDMGLPGGVKYALTGLSIETAMGLPPLRSSSRRFARLLPAAGFTLTYNQSLRYYHESSLIHFPDAPDLTGSTPLRRLQPAALLGFHWNLGATRVSILQGWVLAHPDPILGRRHLHAAISHAFNAHHRIELGLRSYQVRAEHPFLGWVYTL